MDAGCGRRSRCRGATAVEFVLIFPAMFVLFYGIIAYAYLFVIQESLTYAAQEGATAAVTVDPRIPAGYADAVEAAVQERIETVLAWLPSDQQSRLEGASNGRYSSVETTASGTVVEVAMRFDVGGLFPVITLPPLGPLPPMPESLLSSSSVLVGEN